MKNQKILEINNLHVEIKGKEILKELNLKLDFGKINALMGPNGSGKSTLVNTIMGHPKNKITKGEIKFNGEDITKLSPDKRAKKGIFLSFQNPQEISGVSVSKFLKTALKELKNDFSISKFRKNLNEKTKMLNISEKTNERNLNEGFSGGEKKKNEILQMLTLNPKLILIDEVDSGLDIDSLKTIAKVIRKTIDNKKSILIITHYKRILEHIKPDKVYIMDKGKIVLEGDKNLATKLEKKGYKGIHK